MICANVCRYGWLGAELGISLAFMEGKQVLEEVSVVIKRAGGSPFLMEWRALRSSQFGLDSESCTSFVLGF